MKFPINSRFKLFLETIVLLQLDFQLYLNNFFNKTLDRTLVKPLTQHIQ